MPVGALTLTGFVPTVVATNNKNITIGLGVLTLVGFNPTVSVTNNLNVSPSLGQLIAAGFVPTVAVTNNNAASITFTIASDSTWLTATSTTLTIPAASNQNVTVTADTIALSSGVYSGNITITPSLGSPTIIPVSITVL